MASPGPEPHDAEVRIAESIADGVPVSWERELGAPGSDPRRIEALRLVERVATVHGADPALPDTLASTRGIDSAAGGTWGPLRLIEKLGEGAFGEVWRAFDPSLEREVALKLRRPGTTLGEDRFLREGRRLARIRHPNVLVVHGADRHDGRAGLWTDLLAGRTLAECVAEQGVYSAEEAARLGIDICRALAAVHAAGLVHCDVKGSNVMRETGGRIVLVDFGCASASPLLTDATADDFSGGTPQFMAPEQLRGAEPSPAFDIHATGVLLYWLVTQRYPVDARSLPELISRVERGERTPLRDARPDLPAAYVQAVERATAPDPKDRYPSAGAMESALLATLGAGAVHPGAIAAPAAGTIPAARSSRRWLVRGAAALLLLAAGLGAAFLIPDREFTIEASFYRAGDEEVRLRPSSRVRVGDQLFLEVTPSREVHIYVVNEDEMGRTHVLFPNEDGLLGNPLQGGVEHRLPGKFPDPRGPLEHHWTVNTVGGTEHFLIVASRRPLPELERRVAEIALAAKRGEGDEQPGLGEVATAELRGFSPRTRGVGSHVAATTPAGGGAPGRLAEIVADLPEEQVQSVDGVLVRRFQLANPPP